MRFFLIILCLFSTSVFAMSWDEYLAQKKAQVINPRHLPYQLTHGYKTEKSVLLVHGVYSSPLYFQGMAQAFYKAGFNVVTVLLPGHYDKDIRSIQQVQNADWSNEVDLGYAFARQLGDKVILAGHSLGGLLSVEQALKRPREELAGLVIISPALKVWPAVLLACRAGVALGLSGNVFTPHKPDGDDIPYFAPIAGPLIQSLSNRVLTKPLAVPTYLAYTWNDNVVDVPFLRGFAKKLPRESQVRVYGLFSGVAHGDISQGPEDAATYGNKTNHDFHNMMNEALDFLARH